jgi:phosphate transport system protein
VTAVLEGDGDLATNVVLNDHAVNRGFENIDDMCHKFLALHLPSAGHLRLISSILRMNGEFERIGDHAVTIAREALQLSESPTNAARAAVVDMAGDTQTMLRHAIKAFNANDAELARKTMGMSARVQKAFDAVFRDLANEGETKPGSVHDLLVLSVVFSKLERVSARAENICEETLYAIAGESPPKRKFKILFLDETNSAQSRLAQAVGQKTAAERCTFDSMGRTAADDLYPGLAEFMEAHGLSVQERSARALPDDRDDLDDYDVIISLDGPVKSYIADQPFHSVFLTWDVGDLPGGADQANRVNIYHQMYRELTTRIRDLDERLRGERTV